MQFASPEVQKWKAYFRPYNEELICVSLIIKILHTALYYTFVSILGISWRSTSLHLPSLYQRKRFVQTYLLGIVEEISDTKTKSRYCKYIDQLVFCTTFLSRFIKNFNCYV